MKLEQLERLCSEIAPPLPRRPMITHTSDSHQIPSQNKTKSKQQIKKNAKNANCKKLYTRHTFWSSLMRWMNMKLIQPGL